MYADAYTSTYFVYKCKSSTNYQTMTTSVKATSVLWTLMFACLVVSSTARPSSFYEFGSQPHENKCKEGDTVVVEVCQRCAKQTKSPIVYPMCCVNEDDVYNWCGRYINYGKQSK